MNQFFLYPSSSANFKNKANLNYFRNKEISYKKIENAYALPPKNVWQEGKKIRWGGVVDSNGAYLKESGRFRNETHTLETGVMMGGYEFNKTFCPTIKGEVIYLGEYLDHWGHFLLESTTRLWYVVQNRRPNQKLVFVAQKKLKITGNFKNFFNLLGIEIKDIILITRPTKLEGVIVPEPSSVLGCYYTKEFSEPFLKVQEHVAPETIERIYLSRRKCNIRFIIGEDQLESVFKQNGFTVIYPEKLPLQKLIALFKGAEYIAGVSGSSMHNALFAPAQTKLIVLNRTQNFNQPQGLINQAMNIDSAFVDAYFNFLPVENFYWLGITSPFKEMCQTYNFSLNKVPPPTPKQAKIFFNRWLKELPRQTEVLTPEYFRNSSEVAHLLFSQMTLFSPLHQKMDLLKYGVLSKISWGAHKKKYKTKLRHYQEKYGVLPKN